MPAAAQYARAAKLGLEAQNHAAEVKLNAERKAGELLGGLERASHNRGNQHKQATSQDGAQPSEYRQALDDADVAKSTANRWQTIAKLPDEKFHSYIEGARISSIVGISSGKLSASIPNAAPMPARDLSPSGNK